MSYYSNMFVWFCWMLWALLNQSFFCESSRQRWLCGKPLADTLDTLCAGRGFHMGKRNGRSIGSVYSKHTDKSSSSQNNGIPFPHPNSFINHNIFSNKNNNNNINDNNDKDSIISAIKDFDSNQPKGIYPNNKRLSYFNQKRLELVNFLSKVHVTRPYSYTEVYLRGLGNDYFKDSEDENIPEELAVQNGGLMTYDFSRRRKRQAGTLNIVEECCLQRCGIPTLLSYCASSDEPEMDLPEHILRQWFGMTTLPPTTTQRPRGLGARRPPAQINRGSGRPQHDYFYVRTENQATRSPLLVDRQQQQQQHQHQQQQS